MSCIIIRTLRRVLGRVGAYKPVASGVYDSIDSDATRLWEATGCIQPLEMVCPQTFMAPLAPPLAASMENRKVDGSLLKSGAEAWNGLCDFLVVEGAGGLLSPLTFETTNADLAAHFGWPIVIVVANRLGAINQSLMAFEVAQAKNLKVAAIILNAISKPATNRDDDSHSMIIRSLIQSSHPEVPPIIKLAHGSTKMCEQGNRMLELIQQNSGASAKSVGIRYKV